MISSTLAEMAAKRYCAALWFLVNIAGHYEERESETRIYIMAQTGLDGFVCVQCGGGEQSAG